MSVFLYVFAAALTIYLAQRVRPFARITAAVLLLLPLSLTGRALFTGGVYGPVDLAYTSEPLASTPQAMRIDHVVNPELSDVYSEFIPWNHALRRSIALHEFPLWNPYEMFGTPLAGAAQVAPYHPITVAGLFVPLPKYWAFAAAMLHLFAAVSAFLFFRELVESDGPALFGAAAWTLSTHIIFFAGTALGNAAAVMPLVLLGARRIVREPGFRSAVLLGLALLLVVLSGHPESALHVVSFGVAYFVYERIVFRPPQPERLLVLGLATGVTVLLLSAVFLLPHLAVISESVEYQQRLFAYGPISSTPAQMAHRAVANSFPFLEGRSGVEQARHRRGLEHGWLATAYAGSILFAPAIFALFRSPAREKWFFLGAIIFGLGAGIGAPGIGHVLRVLPGFAMAINDRMIAFAALGLCGLSALGVDAWLRGRRSRLAAAFLVTAVLIALASIVIHSQVSEDYLRLGLARAVVPLLLAAAAIKVLSPRAAVSALIALLVIQRLGEAGNLQPTLPSSLFYPEFAGLELMKSAEPFRVVALSSLLPPAISTHYDLEDARGFQAVTLARYDATIPLWSVRQHVWSNRVENLSSPFLSLANVRYALVPSHFAEPEGWKRRRDAGSYAIAENTRVLPRAFVPRTVHVVESKKASLRGVSGARDFSAEAWIEGNAEQTFANGPGKAAIEGRGRRLRLRATMSRPGWVVVSNAAWSGWRATVEGRELPIRYANHTFLAVHVPKGDHKILLIYRPRAFVIGAWISGLTAALLLACALIAARARTSHEGMPESSLHMPHGLRGENQHARHGGSAKVFSVRERARRAMSCRKASYVDP